ncbi:PVC-type heme-binding CxxCH protein [Adhaeribacter radiodurans]|uniref:HEAT repeat domain-containing protein n=1 Tax=Adhaeribacter radiodurans TaxID=2745197 RepID=A0A7L7L873_9BACT|nr:PVC-type heme-binding CxxCH protein [Adhaeribacter radiodurans]QMU28745.1 HEAT repeat domain-containing protein [Adhaeribacter radiodurans]
MNKKFLTLIVPVLLSFLFSCSRNEVVNSLNPEQNSKIVFLGNTFAVGLQDQNYFETLLYKSFPERNLKIRNLAWSADEVNLQPRPVNFGTVYEHLQEQKADIIFAFFGLNEAFQGSDSLESFKHQLANYLRHLQQQKFNGHSNPQIILVSPIAHEMLGGFLPDPAVHNQNLKQYTQGMQEVAQKLNIPFINLYEPTAERMKSETDSLTSNGIYLNERGYKAVSEIMAQALDLSISTWTNDLFSIHLQKAIGIKNRHFFYKYKAGNEEYIYGRRREWAGGQTLRSELAKIDKIILRLDSAIWKGVKTSNGPDIKKIQNIIQYNKQYEPLKESREALTKAKSQFVLPKGYQIELFASELDFPVANPVSFTFDAKGRMWVGTMPSYPHYYPGSPPNDQIIILEDTNQDGKADKHRVFADSLYLPLGFELGDGGAYVTQAPDFVFLKDTNGDGKADSRKILLRGFGTEDAHHAISNYTWGPDGALYMHEGTFLHSQIETPYGPVRGANGVTWRYEPRTMKLEPYVSYPYANPWGNVFTRNGTHIIGDVSTGMNYFAPPLTVAINYPIKHKEMKDFLTSRQRPKTCGIEIVSSRQFPESAQGNILFNTFIGFQGIKQHKLTEKGSGIVAEEIEPLLQSKDPSFRPVDLKFGPDGALYVLDWYDPIIQHGEQGFRESQRDHTRGRIWRITYQNKAALKPIDLTRLSINELLNQLTVYEDRIRYRARTQLREFPEEQVIPVLEKWLAQLNPSDPNYEYYKLEGLWVYQQFNHPEEKLLAELLKSKDYSIRAAATRVLFYQKEKIKGAEKKLITMSQDPAPRVRVEAIAALSNFPSEAVVKALLATTELPTDDYIDYALAESFKHLKPVWMAMFRKDKAFLANEPEKANRLLRPLASQKDLDATEYFVKDDPMWHSFSYRALSQEDYTALENVTAVTQFRNNLKVLPTSDQIRNVNAAKSSSPKKEGLVIHLASLPGKMLFDKSTITIPANKLISLIFENRDQMAHNVVIVMPGSMEKVGKAADAMASLKDGYEKNFVPDLPEVLFATPLVNAGKSFRLNFKSPSKPGMYPFICSFPGHWQVMKGIIQVTNEQVALN